MYVGHALVQRIYHLVLFPEYSFLVLLLRLEELSISLLEIGVDTPDMRIVVLLPTHQYQALVLLNLAKRVLRPHLLL